MRDVHASSVQLDFDALYAQSPMPKSLHSSLPEAPAPATPEMPSNSCTFDAATTRPDNQSITLRNWYLQHAVKNEVSTGSVSAERGSLCIAVEGTVVHATRPSAGVLWHSSAIEERLADGTVRSFTGSTYRFAFLLVLLCMRNDGCVAGGWLQLGGRAQTYLAALPLPLT